MDTVAANDFTYNSGLYVNFASSGIDDTTKHLIRMFNSDKSNAIKINPKLNATTR